METLSKVDGVQKILTVENEALKGSLAEVLTNIVLDAQKQFSFTHILSGASSVGKVNIWLIFFGFLFNLIEIYRT